jgi:hypothetical protein
MSAVQPGWSVSHVSAMTRIRPKDLETGEGGGSHE